MGVPGEARGEAPGDRLPGGHFAPGNSLARAGGYAKAGQTQLANKLGLAKRPESDFAPYKRAAAVYRRVRCAELARSVGGGFCCPGPSSIVASAALALAWSRYFSDKAAETGDADFALKSARLGEVSRQHNLAAHELCAREAQARMKALPPADPLGRYVEAPQ